jgi:hypothetical protein
MHTPAALGTCRSWLFTCQAYDCVLINAANASHYAHVISIGLCSGHVDAGADLHLCCS